MHVDRIPNRTSPPAFLLRETYREDGKVKKRTLANITHWPAGKIEALRRLLRDEYAPDLKLMRSLPHGHVAAALVCVAVDLVLSHWPVMKEAAWPMLAAPELVSCPNATVAPA